MNKYGKSQHGYYLMKIKKKKDLCIGGEARGSLSVSVC